MSRRFAGPWTALQWLVRGAVLVVLLPVAALSIANIAAPLGSSRWELLRYLPFPVFLAPAVVVLALSFMLAPGWRWAAWLSVLMVTTAVMGLAVGSADTGTSAGTVRFRVMTYNVKSSLAEVRPGAFEALMREIALQAPDILVMQDAGDLAALHSREPETGAALYADRHVVMLGQYAIVSRFRLSACRTGDLGYRGLSADFARCTVTIEGREIDLVTAHLLSPRAGLNAIRHGGRAGWDDWRQNVADRLLQARELASAVATRVRPLVLAGDLNAPSPSPVIRVLQAEMLRDAFASAGAGYGYTLGHALAIGFSFLRLDHVLVSPEIGVADCFVGDKDGSEHRPVIADLLLQRDPR